MTTENQAPEGAQADERAAFEAFCLTQPFLSKLSHVIGRDCYSDAGYDHAAVNAAWHAFQAGRAALAAPAPQAPAWQPIETAPKDGSLFLCWVMAVRYGETDEGQQYQEEVSQADFCHWQSHDDAPNGGWFEPCCGQIGDGQDVTHWMPLPAAPQTKEQP